MLRVIAAVLVLFAAAQGQSAIRVDGGLVAEVQPDADGVRVYKGLPYAAPPVGDLRWRPPTAVMPWFGMRPANAYAPNCLQPKIYDDVDPFVPAMSEDCLYLNVWTAAKMGDRLPVLVWIHGGSYRAGYGGEPRHDGMVLAKKGVVVVTLNYRLGAFGFLAHPELTAESPQHASGNYAFLDMIAALQWVRHNIEAFGGDPARVTIAGESAGSDAVSRLMASPLAQGLFQAAIGESGSSFGTIKETSLPAAELNGVVFANAFDGDDLARLRKRSAAEIMAQMTATRKGWEPFTPVIDGWFLPEAPQVLFAKGQQNDVPLLLGWNADEGATFMGVLERRSLNELLGEMFADRTAEALKFYPTATMQQAMASRRLLAGDVTMALPTWKWAAAQAKTGHAPVYLYLFRRQVPMAVSWAKGLGAFHSSEIPYVFGHPNSFADWDPAEEDFRLADLMSSYWAAFARTGAPAGGGLPDWPRYDPNGKALRMVFDVKSAVEPDSSLPRHRFAAEAMVTKTVEKKTTDKKKAEKKKAEKK